MGLEAASFLNGLNSSNPTSGDPRSEGDDHLRLIKSVLLATFPNLNAAVNTTPTELNLLASAPASSGVSFRSTSTRQLQATTGLRYSSLGLNNTPAIDLSAAQVFKGDVNSSLIATLSNPQPGAFGALIFENQAAGAVSATFLGGGGATVYRIYPASATIPGTSSPGQNQAMALYFATSTTAIYLAFLTNP